MPSIVSERQVDVLMELMSCGSVRSVIDKFGSLEDAMMRNYLN